MEKNKLIVLSLGGSIIIPKSGFDINFLKSFKNLILKFVKKGYRFIIVCGGGQTARSYQEIAREFNLSSDDVDWVGINATWLNSSLMKSVFKEQAYSEVIKNPTEKVAWKTPILIAGGWKPGFSTDYDAVELAELYNIKKVINLSNISYICDKDPKKFKDAKKIEEMSWNDFRKIIGDKWIPGANLPFDPIASKLAQKLGLILDFVNGTDLAEVEKAIAGSKFMGTVVSGV